VKDFRKVGGRAFAEGLFFLLFSFFFSYFPCTRPCSWGKEVGNLLMGGKRSFPSSFFLLFGLFSLPFFSRLGLRGRGGEVGSPGRLAFLFFFSFVPSSLFFAVGSGEEAAFGLGSFFPPSWASFPFFFFLFCLVEVRRRRGGERRTGLAHNLSLFFFLSLNSSFPPQFFLQGGLVKMSKVVFGWALPFLPPFSFFYSPPPFLVFFVR